MAIGNFRLTIATLGCALLAQTGAAHAERGFRMGHMGGHMGGFSAGGHSMGRIQTGGIQMGGFGGAGFVGGPSAGGFSHGGALAPSVGFRTGWGGQPMMGGWGWRHRHPWTHGWPLNAGLVGAGLGWGSYGWPYYPAGFGNCLRPRVVATPWGWRRQWVNVCGPWGYDGWNGAPLGVSVGWGPGFGSWGGWW